MNDVFKGHWYKQKNLDEIGYIAVHQMLDRMSIDGLTSRQIEEVLRLGYEIYKFKRDVHPMNGDLDVLTVAELKDFVKDWPDIGKGA